jgi:hypothetical protein
VNVLWIEDFGGNSTPNLAMTLFSDLARENAFDNWDGVDPVADPQAVDRFFEVHSDIHRVTLLRHYGDFIKKKETADISLDYDVAVIDIDLSKGAGNISPPSDIAAVNPDEFHRRAGLYIYYDLLRTGFPADQMVFYTGEPKTSKQFEEFCDNALVPRPKVFVKEEPDEMGTNAFKTWLLGYRRASFMTLRRGIIEGCKTLQEIAQKPNRIQFNQFRPNNPVSKKDIEDYLLSLSRFLTAKCPRKEDSPPHTLRLLARAIVHEWEGDSESESGAHPKHISEKKCRPLHSMGWVMKTTRNWMAHSQVLNGLSPQDVAYLFVVNMRTMFVLPSKVELYEKILLSNFQTATTWPSKLVIKDALEESYRKLEAEYHKAGGEGPLYKFQRLANETQKVGAALNYSILLYQILWHQLANGNFDPRLKAYTSNCDDSAFRFGIGEDDFLRMMLMVIFARSFAG